MQELGDRSIASAVSGRLATRRERAFERAFRRHVGDVFHYALAVLSDPLDAEAATRATESHTGRFRRRRAVHVQRWALRSIVSIPVPQTGLSFGPWRQQRKVLPDPASP